MKDKTYDKTITIYVHKVDTLQIIDNKKMFEYTKILFYEVV